MSRAHDRNQPYRRPRLHFSDEKQPHTPSVSSRSLLTGSAMLLGLALLMVLAMIPLRASEEDAAQAANYRGRRRHNCAGIEKVTTGRWCEGDERAYEVVKAD